MRLLSISADLFLLKMAEKVLNKAQICLQNIALLTFLKKSEQSAHLVMRIDIVAINCFYDPSAVESVILNGQPSEGLRVFGTLLLKKVPQSSTRLFIVNFWHNSRSIIKQKRRLWEQTNTLTYWTNLALKPLSYLYL